MALHAATAVALKRHERANAFNLVWLYIWSDRLIGGRNY